MFKVFLVEDEIVVREGLRNSIPWEQYGFTLVGDASDGEMALPMIREQQPDLLITDIKMPFMDGLALSELVRKELPKTKIVIISGYDEFTYAQQAIRMGVEQYMLKPVTKDKMVQILIELQKKMEAEAHQADYLLQFQNEAQEYEAFSRHRFFEQIVYGELTVSEIYETARSMDMDVSAQAYNIVFMAFGGAGYKDGVPGYTEALADGESRITQFLLSQSDLLLFRWNLTTYAVLVKGTPEDIERRTEACIGGIRDICGSMEEEIDWYAASGTPVERISALPTCFMEANRAISYRHICPGEHILSAESIERFHREGSAAKGAEDTTIDPRLITNFLGDGTEEEIDGFLAQILQLVNADASVLPLFLRYLAMVIGYEASEFLAGITSEPLFTPELREARRTVTADTGLSYMHELLARTIALRDKESRKRKRDILVQTTAYINEHYAEESISLNKAAREVNISPNYLSAVFSQEEGQTFVEYLTEKRIEEAKRLLLTQDIRAGEVASAVGYRDSHYFSFVFKKKVGVSPREYRRMGAQ